MSGRGKSVVVPLNVWEDLRRMVQHVSLIRDQLDRLIAAIYDAQAP